MVSAARMAPGTLLMKYKDGNFIQLNRDIFRHRLSWQAKWLYTALTELEHRFTDGWGHKDYFCRSTEELEGDTGMTDKTVRKYRRELEEAGLIKTWKLHGEDGAGKKSEDYVMAFMVLS